MNADEDLDEQTPADTKPTRYPECRCPNPGRGGCICPDDGEGAAEWDGVGVRRKCERPGYQPRRPVALSCSAKNTGTLPPPAPEVKRRD